MSENEAQSKQVRDVLGSEVFKAWMPEERQYVDIEPNSQLVLCSFLLLGLACVVGLIFWTSRDIFILYERILAVLLFSFMLGSAFWAFGRGQIVRFTRDSIEIGDSKRVMLDCAWNEILEVRKTKKNRHEIVTADGSAAIVWPPIVMSKDGYSYFLRATLEAMALGNAGSDFERYGVPTDLTPGHEYVYEYRPRAELIVITVLMYLLPIAMPFMILKAIQHRDIMEFIMIFSQGLIWLQARDKKQTVEREIGNVRVIVGEHEISVMRPKSTVSVVNDRIHGKLVPTVTPFPMRGAESFGDGSKSIVIDRRFLRDTTA